MHSSDPDAKFYLCDKHASEANNRTRRTAQAIGLPYERYRRIGIASSDSHCGVRTNTYRGMACPNTAMVWKKVWQTVDPLT